MMKWPRLLGPGIILFTLGALSTGFVHSEIRLAGLNFRIYTPAYIARENDRTNQVIDNQEQLTEYWTQLRSPQGASVNPAGNQSGNQTTDLVSEYLNTGPPTIDLTKEFFIIFSTRVHVRSIISNGTEVFVRYSSPDEAGQPAGSASNRLAYLTAVAVTRPANWPVPVIYHEIE